MGRCSRGSISHIALAQDTPATNSTSVSIPASIHNLSSVQSTAHTDATINKEPIPRSDTVSAGCLGRLALLKSRKSAEKERNYFKNVLAAAQDKSPHHQDTPKPSKNASCSRPASVPASVNGLKSTHTDSIHRRDCMLQYSTMEQCSRATAPPHLEYTHTEHIHRRDCMPQHSTMEPFSRATIPREVKYKIAQGMRFRNSCLARTP